VRPLARAAGVMLPAAALARLGLPALGALVFLAVLAVTVTCWIISSPDRADRLNRLMLAARGDARCLKPTHSPRHRPLPRQPDDKG
jgi:hypothetical protein